MFDIAWSELLLIAVIALIFIGPKELPQVLHSLGRMTAKLRRSADDFRRQFEDSMREAGYEDLHKNIQDFRSLNPTNQLKDSITRAINQDYTPKPAPSIQHPSVEQSQTDMKAPEGEQQPTPLAHAGGSNEAAVQAQVVAPAEKPAAEAPAQPAASPGPTGEQSKDRVAPAA